MELCLVLFAINICIIFTGGLDLSSPLLAGGAGGSGSYGFGFDGEGWGVALPRRSPLCAAALFHPIAVAIGLGSPRFKATAAGSGSFGARSGTGAGGLAFTPSGQLTYIPDHAVIASSPPRLSSPATAASASVRRRSSCGDLRLRVSQDPKKKADAEYLNTPIDHYREMFKIFGSKMATGKFVKGSSEPLGTAAVGGTAVGGTAVGGTELDDGAEATTSTATAAATTADGSESSTPKVVRHNADADGATSSAPKPKRVKTNECEEYGNLVKAIREVGKDLSQAIKEAGMPSFPPGLYTTLKSLLGFDSICLTFYYSYLINNSRIAWAFHELTFEDKLVWVAAFISEKFSRN